MPANRPHQCRVCGGWDHEVGRVSWSGLCARCGSERLSAHHRAMNSKQGPEYEAWVLACAAASAQRAMQLLDGTAALDRQGHSNGSAAAPQP